MKEVTSILSAIEQGEPHAAEQLLPLVYDELPQLAAQKLAQETPGQTLQAPPVVQEGSRAVVGENKKQPGAGRGHFCAAAAEAMRRIRGETARRKHRQKRGGGRAPQALEPDQVAAPEFSEDLLGLDDAL